MPFALLLADSEVASVTWQGATLVIRLAAANVERASTPPGRSPDNGYSQGICLWLSEAAVHADVSPLFGRIAQAALHVDGTAMPSVPVPFETSSPVRLELHLPHRAYLLASGCSMSVRFDGEANFREAIAC